MFQMNRRTDVFSFHLEPGNNIKNKHKKQTAEMKNVTKKIDVLYDTLGKFITTLYLIRYPLASCAVVFSCSQDIRF